MSRTFASRLVPSETNSKGQFQHFIARPIIAMALAFAAGGWLAYSPSLLLFLPIALFLGRGRLFLVSCLFGIGMVRALLVAGGTPLLSEGTRSVVGYVATMPELGIGYQRFVLRTPRVDILVYSSTDRLLAPGDRVEVTGRVSTLRGEQAEYWGRRRVRQCVYAQSSGSGVEVRSQAPELSVAMARWRMSVWKALRAHLPYEPASVAMAILLGQDCLLQEQTAQDMRQAGTYHLVATSGFNVLILVGGVMLLLSHLPLPRWAQVGLALVLLVLYALAVGMNPPIVRAIMMASIYLSAMFFFRIPDALSAWGTAALAYLAVYPYAVLDAGFQLTFGVVLALILYLPPALRFVSGWAERRFKRNSLRLLCLALVVPLLTTVIAQAASLPILAHHFGQASLIAPVANLFTAAAVPFVYIGSAASLLFRPMSEMLSEGFDLLITGSFSQWIVSVNEFFAGLPYSSLRFPPVPAWASALGFLWVPLFSRPNLYPVPTPEEAAGERLDERF